jgi:hypothetical protein
MSNTKESPWVAILTTTFAVAATATATYAATKRWEEDKQKARLWKQYQREKMLREKTAAAREGIDAPPSGKLITDIFVDKVYLWEVEDLRKSFDSSNLKNDMKFKYFVHRPPIVSPKLRHNLSSASLTHETASTRTVDYNRLITDHECVLGKIVRKPNMPTHSIAYMRAGPRRYL